MLHENVCMADINVDHWRNMQDLLLDSAKEKRRIILIHEGGKLLKFVHSARAEINRNINEVANPAQAAETVYRANAANADFVMVLERRAVDRFFARVQNSWKAEEDLDVYVNRMFAALDEYPEGIVTYPGPARTMLGLQWRLGASYEAIKEAVNRFIPANTTVVFGVFLNDSLWASLVLGLDADKRISLITTADTEDLTLKPGWKKAAKELVQWVNGKHAPCSLGLFMDLHDAQSFLVAEEKLSFLRELGNRGKLVLDPVCGPLADMLPAHC